MKENQQRPMTGTGSDNLNGGSFPARRASTLRPHLPTHQSATQEKTPRALTQARIIAASKNKNLFLQFMLQSSCSLWFNNLDLIL